MKIHTKINWLNTYFTIFRARLSFLQISPILNGLFSLERRQNSKTSVIIKEVLNKVVKMYMYKIQAMWVFISLHEGILYTDLSRFPQYHILYSLLKQLN